MNDMHASSDGRRRVQKNTPEGVNEKIRRQMEASLAHYARRLDEIEARLKELDREWDIERRVELDAGIAILGGTVLGLFSRRWRFFPAFVAGCLILHAVQGWSPLVPILRRLGIRTPAEIEQERQALKALRGDFREVSPDSADDPVAKAAKALDAAD